MNKFSLVCQLTRNVQFFSKLLCILFCHLINIIHDCYQSCTTSIDKLSDLHIVLPTVHSLQSMPSSVWTAEDVAPPSSLKPLPAHLTSTQKAPPGVVPSPLGVSFLCHDNAEWEPNNFIVTCFSDPDSTVPIKVNLFNFVKETPEQYFQLKIDQDKRYYLPHNLILSE